MACLDKINCSPAYSTLVVLPAGGGKTYTASMWLLKNTLDKWLAGEQELYLVVDEAHHSTAKIYSDDIAYQIGPKELINRQTLSKPIFEAYYTDEGYGGSLGMDAWENIQHLDVLPDDLAAIFSGMGLGCRAKADFLEHVWEMERPFLEEIYRKISGGRL